MLSFIQCYFRFDTHSMGAIAVVMLFHLEVRSLSNYSLKQNTMHEKVHCARSLNLNTVYTSFQPIKTHLIYCLVKYHLHFISIVICIEKHFNSTINVILFTLSTPPFIYQWPASIFSLFFLLFTIDSSRSSSVILLPIFLDFTCINSSTTL